MGEFFGRAAAIHYGWHFSGGTGLETIVAHQIQVFMFVDLNSPTGKLHSIMPDQSFLRSWRVNIIC